MRNPDPADIEITPAMFQAGLRALTEHMDVEETDLMFPRALVCDILRAAFVPARIRRGPLAG